MVHVIDYIISHPIKLIEIIDPSFVFEFRAQGGPVYGLEGILHSGCRAVRLICRATTSELLKARRVEGQDMGK